MKKLAKYTLPAALAAALVAAGCGGGSSSSSSGSSAKAPNPNTPEKSPPGDIPDNQAYVAYTPPGQKFSVKVPEGWSRTAAGGAVTFTDKLNNVTIDSAKASVPLTAREARQTEVPKLARSVSGFRPGTVSTVTRKGGQAVRITYLAKAKPNEVTGKAGQDAVERYVFFHNGKDVILTLSGPKGADNVDPWRIITDSVRWSG
jgi:hypothetical protein